MNIPEELRYTKEHEWVKFDGDEALIGITDYAQGELGDIVYLDLPEAGTIVRAGEVFGAIEAVKAAADLYSPLNGEVVAFNGNLEENPETINSDPYGDGWILRIKMPDPKDFGTLLSAEAYGKLIDETSE